MQISSSCGWHDDVAWGVATVLTALLVLPLVPVAIAASVASEVMRQVNGW